MIIRLYDVHKQKQPLAAIVGVANKLGYKITSGVVGNTMVRIETGMEMKQTDHQNFLDREAFIELCNEYKA